MINFRYHLVSLIAVFLALAVGVVLGAGPLQNAITAHEQGSDGGTSIETLQHEVAYARAEGQAGQDFARAVADQVLPESLSDQQVAVIVLPDASPADVDATTEMLELAGAEVLGPVNLNENFVSPDENTYRETLASPVSAHLAQRPSDPSAAAVLGAGLVEALTLDTAESDLVRDLLTDEATPLVEADSLPTQAATALVLIGAGPTDVTADKDEVAPLTQQAWLGLAEALAASGKHAVAVGQASQPEELIAVLRAAATPLSTADQGGTSMGGLNAALVLVSGVEGAFGTQSDATQVLAPLP